MRYLVIALLLLTNACLMGSLSPQKKLNDSIRDVNDSSRWGRIDLAIQYVEPTYRDTFLKSRYKWGRLFRIADTEVVRVELNSDKDRAVSLMSISWYRIDQMTLHHTIVRQKWKDYDGTYLLTAEDVFEGDALLMQAPPSDGTKANDNSLDMAPPS
jgi:hypothetical protein